MILLEDKADIFLVQLDAAAVVQLVHGDCRQVIFALPGAVEHADDAHQRGFAGARGAHDGDKIAFGISRLMRRSTQVFPAPDS